jgi:serine/threonine protein phosphatase 1
MSTWRPSKNCIYVIPDIHGMYQQLQLILSRILPLRNTGGSFDQLIFLGDYIDRRVDSHKVIDRLIKTQEKQPGQVVCIKGNHEKMLEDALDGSTSFGAYNMWMKNGGENTLTGYLDRAGRTDNPYSIPRNCIDAYIPQKHLHWMKNLPTFYETDDFMFVHGGCDPFHPLKDQFNHVLLWDRSMYANVRQMKQTDYLCPWEKMVVTGHSCGIDGNAFFHDKFMMLDSSSVDKLNVIELNSMKMFSARKGKSRLVKEPIV